MLSAGRPRHVIESSAEGRYIVVKDQIICVAAHL